MRSVYAVSFFLSIFAFALSLNPTTMNTSMQFSVDAKSSGLGYWFEVVLSLLMQLLNTLTNYHLFPYSCFKEGR